MKETLVESKLITEDPLIEMRKGLILSCLTNNKAENIISINVKNKSDITDHMIIASGLSKLHISSLVNKITNQIKKEFNIGVEVEGSTNCTWVLICFYNIMVHIFDKETRDYYQLEKMWLL
jgi:ribosome-associated protein